MTGHQASVPLLLAGGAVAVVSVLASAVSKMYQARQETWRLEIEHRSRDLIAAALARCIDATHTPPGGMSLAGQAEEIAKVRDGAGRALGMMPLAVLSALGQHTDQRASWPPGESGRRFEAALNEEP